LAVYVVALVYCAVKTSSVRRIAFAAAFVLLSALPPLEQLLIGPDLQKSRELYLPLAGFCLLLGAVADGLPGRGRWLIPLAAIAFNLGALQHNITIWREAGAIAERACADAARCTRPEKLSISGVPGSLDGVYFLGVGLPECVGIAAQSSSPSAESGGRAIWNDSTRALQCER
jgi:hypothetical protein